MRTLTPIMHSGKSLMLLRNTARKPVKTATSGYGEVSRSARQDALDPGILPQQATESVPGGVVGISAVGGSAVTEQLYVLAGIEFLHQRF